jgi:hypothetical protein
METTAPCTLHTDADAAVKDTARPEEAVATAV